MPSTTASVKPSRFTSSAKAAYSAAFFDSSSTMVSQPSHFASSAPLHTPASRCHRRRTSPSLRQVSMAFFSGASRWPSASACRSRP
jgi:hypothetical protein